MRGARRLVKGEQPVPVATRSRVALPFLVVTLIWGSTWLVIRGQLGVVPPSWSVTYRFAIGGAALFAWAAATRQPLGLARRDQPFVFVVGATQFLLNFNFVYRAEQHIASGLVALLFALLIVPNAGFAALFLRQGVSRQFLTGSAVALAGLGFLFWHELATSPAGPHEVALGVGLSLLAVLSASIANVMQASDRAKAMPMVTLIAWAMLWGTLLDAVLALATAGPPRFDAHPQYWLGTLYLGLFASAAAFMLYFGVIRVIGPGRAAYSSVLVPVIAMSLSTVFEDYRWSLQAAAGAALTLAGLVVALRARKPARQTG